MHKWLKQIKKSKKFSRSISGFVLPTVLVISVIMLSALMMSLSVVWSSRQALKEQFDLQNARNASISGVNVADGCRYGTIPIADTITASTSPLGKMDCGVTNATSSVNPFILKTSYGGATTSFGFSATFLKDANGNPVTIASTSGVKGSSTSSFVRHSRPRALSPDLYAVAPMQSFTKANCPSVLTLARDLRNGNLYWIKKMADGNCWMNTNMSSVTKKTPVPPALPTDGIGEYGDLYLGAGEAYEACPSGWRLPTGGPGGEFALLNNAINSGSTTSDAGLRSSWFAVYGGHQDTSVSPLTNRGTTGNYWSSTPYSVAGYGYSLRITAGSVYPADYEDGSVAYSVRCVAN